MSSDPFTLELADPSKAPCDFLALRIAATVGERDEKAALRELVKRCRDVAFAEQAHYAVREAETNEETDNLCPSIEFMRAAATAWKYVSGGGQILRRFAECVSVRGWAFDAKSGRFVPMDDFVDMWVRKRGKGNDVLLEGSHLRARERAIMASAERRALQNVLPGWLVEKGFAEVLRTLERAELREIEAQGPEAVLARLVEDIVAADVTVDEVERKFGRPLAEFEWKQRTELRGILRSIRTKETQPLDHFSPPEFGASRAPDEQYASAPERVEPSAPIVTKPTPSKPAPDVSGSDWRNR